VILKINPDKLPHNILFYMDEQAIREKGIAKEVYVIGDAQKIGKAMMPYEMDLRLGRKNLNSYFNKMSDEDKKEINIFN
jgi:hypothetical protein